MKTVAGTLCLSLAVVLCACTSTPEGQPRDVGIDRPIWHDFGQVDHGEPPVDTGEDVIESDVIDCEPLKFECATPTVQRQCNQFGDGWTEAECPAKHGCVDGHCVPWDCTPLDSTGVCTGPMSYERCNETGSAMETVTCYSGTKCHLGICILQFCAPGQKVCKSPNQVQVCDSSGDFWVDGEICPKGGVCDKGTCLSPCQVNIKSGSYLGCEYWAMDLDNIEDSQFADVGLVVSVPADKASTDVTVYGPANPAIPLTPAELGVTSTTVLPGQLQVFKLPGGWDVDGSELTNKTFHIETTSPVAIHQFNPLNGAGVYTNDASLLLPSNVTGREYIIMSWQHRKDSDTAQLRGFATIIATEPETTAITVVPSAPVVAGSQIAELVPGTPYLFVLSQGQALNFETDGEEGEDLTGTIVEADKKISVIAGHECANVPLGISACDHLEQQLFPVETWSTEYVADAFKHRSPTQVDIYRVIAGRNDVTVTTSPPVPGYGQFKLQRGQWIQFSSATSFHIESDGPIMVGHYMTGANYPGAVEVEACKFSDVGKPEPIGDPAFTLAAPVKRYLPQYTVLTPPGYMEGQNYLNIIVRTGTTVTIDGGPVSSPYVPVSGTDYAVATVNVAPGVHTVTGTKSFGLTVYGYDCDVSYAYPGGLKLVGFDG